MQSKSSLEHIPMVEFVRHTLLLGSVGFDVNNVTDSVVDQVCRHFNRAMFC